MRAYLWSALLGILVVVVTSLPVLGSLDQGGFVLVITTFSIQLGAFVAVIAAGCVLLRRRLRHPERPGSP